MEKKALLIVYDYELVLSCCLEPRILGFCALMKAFLSSTAVATVGEKDKNRGAKCENCR